MFYSYYSDAYLHYHIQTLILPATTEKPASKRIVRYDLLYYTSHYHGNHQLYTYHTLQRSKLITSQYVFQKSGEVPLKKKKVTLCITGIIQSGGMGGRRERDRILQQFKKKTTLKLAPITYKLHQREKAFPGCHS